MTALVQICVPEWIIWGRRRPAVACPVNFAVHNLRLNRICIEPQPSHTFTIALANLKTNNNCGNDQYIIAEHTLLTSHFAQHLHKHASMMVRRRLQTQIPMLKSSYYFSANCTRCPAHHPPGSRLTSSKRRTPTICEHHNQNPLNKNETL